MAFETNPQPKQPYTYQRYPLAMHRGQWPNIESRLARSEAEEQEAKAHGWSTKAPEVPTPGEEPKPLTLEERVLALEAKVFRGKK